MKEINIKQTNVTGNKIKIGKFYLDHDLFSGLIVYNNHDTKEVMKRLKDGETDFIVPFGFSGTGKVRYEVL